MNLTEKDIKTITDLISEIRSGKQKMLVEKLSPIELEQSPLKESLLSESFNDTDNMLKNGYRSTKLTVKEMDTSDPKFHKFRDALARKLKVPYGAVGLGNSDKKGVWNVLVYKKLDTGKYKPKTYNIPIAKGNAECVWPEEPIKIELTSEAFYDAKKRKGQTTVWVSGLFGTSVDVVSVRKTKKAKAEYRFMSDRFTKKSRLDIIKTANKNWGGYWYHIDKSIWKEIGLKTDKVYFKFKTKREALDFFKKARNIDLGLTADEIKKVLV